MGELLQEFQEKERYDKSRPFKDKCRNCKRDCSKCEEILTRCYDYICIKSTRCDEAMLSIGLQVGIEAEFIGNEWSF